MKYDPIESYKMVLREIRHSSLKIEKSGKSKAECLDHYIENTLNPIKEIMEVCELIILIKNRVYEHKKQISLQGNI